MMGNQDVTDMMENISDEKFKIIGMRGGGLGRIKWLSWR